MRHRLVCIRACRLLVWGEAPHVFLPLSFLQHFINGSVCLDFPVLSSIFSWPMTWLPHTEPRNNTMSKRALILCNRCEFHSHKNRICLLISTLHKHVGCKFRFTVLPQGAQIRSCFQKPAHRILRAKWQSCITAERTSEPLCG